LSDFLTVVVLAGGVAAASLLTRGLVGVESRLMVADDIFFAGTPFGSKLAQFSLLRRSMPATLALRSHHGLSQSSSSTSSSCDSLLNVHSGAVSKMRKNVTAHASATFAHLQTAPHTSVAGRSLPWGVVAVAEEEMSFLTGDLGGEGR
jgi:hypothetical protein